MNGGFLTIMNKSEILAVIKRKHGTITAFADHFHTPREVVYQSVNGRGSIRIRAAIAQTVGKRPATIWKNKPLSDDQLFEVKADVNEYTGEVLTPWMRASEAADYLRLDVKTLRNYVAGGLVPFSKNVGTGSLRFHRQVLDQWLLKGIK